MTGPGVRIDRERCNGCGLCLSVCPDNTFTLERGEVRVTGERCMGCGHCQAVCPRKAVQVAANTVSLDFATFAEELDWLPYGEYDVTSLVRLMRSRRSCRNYLDRPVELDLLTDLVRVGTTAPSGTNSQQWTFTVLKERQEVVELGNLVAAFYRRLNRLAANPLLRFTSRLFLQDRLGNYYRRYYRTVARGLEAWENEGRDRLFHGATAAILVGTAPGASCPVEDALLASQNILLAAHAMGLGSCLIGFVVEAMKRDPAIARRLGIPAEEAIRSVIALGYPAESYRKVAGRRPVTPRHLPSP